MADLSDSTFVINIKWLTALGYLCCQPKALSCILWLFGLYLPKEVTVGGISKRRLLLQCCEILLCTVAFGCVSKASTCAAPWMENNAGGAVKKNNLTANQGSL